MGRGHPAAGELRPHDERRRLQGARAPGLVEQGYTILLTIGDQESDLAGGFAERGFKLPNPVYFLP